MFDHISWSQYLTAVVLIVILYESVILLFFYREEIQAFLERKGKKTTSENSDAYIPDVAQEEITDSLVQVVGDLRGILQAAGRQGSKEQLLALLKARLINYAGLGHPAFRSQINQYIIKHVQDICGAVFSTEELNAEWDRTPR